MPPLAPVPNVPSLLALGNWDHCSAGRVRATFSHMRWPFSIPADLRNRLAGVLSTRQCGPPEVWGEIRDWLEEKGVQMPEGIEVEKPPEGHAQRDQ